MFHPKGPTFWELTRQALSSTERGYDLLAPKFEDTPFRTPDEVLSPSVATLTRQVGSALDICCGTGAAMVHLRPHVRERLVGLDMSRGMMAEAEKRVAGVPGPAKLEWVRGDALTMPFEAEFDLAVCFGALGHILPKDQTQFAEAVARVLKPGGIFLFTTGYRPPIKSISYWLSRAFNGAIRVRNLLWPREFIMYYLTFCLPEAREILEGSGFSVALADNLFPEPFQSLILVRATKI